MADVEPRRVSSKTASHAAGPRPPGRGRWDDAMSEARTRFFKDFSRIATHALRLETVAPGTYRSVQLWTPAAQRTVYGGQLVAHTVEAAYRTVDAVRMFIHSLRITFIAAGDSTLASCPVEYHVEALRDGRSFCLRQIRATQRGRPLLLAVAGFHRAEVAGIYHELALPHFAQRHVGLDRTMSTAEAFEGRLTALLTAAAPPRGDEESTLTASGAEITYLNLAATAGATDGGAARSSAPQDVWACLSREALALLERESGIPLSRLPLIVGCWLSDFIVALAALAPHGLPNPNLRMIVSLDHAIYFHNPHRIKVDDWFVYEVRSSWAGNNRGLNHGRMYGRDGRVWMSVAQETLIRMREGYLSKV